MLNRIFLWIYCMDYHRVLLLLALVTGLFWMMHSRLERRKPWRIALVLLILGWVAAVAAATLLQRTANGNLQPIWQPLQSYVEALREGGQKELLRSNFMNAVLFYPGGLLLAAMLPKEWKPWAAVALTVGVCALLSVAVEYLQFRLCLGIAQTDDVIHNVLGAFLAAMVITILHKLRK